MENFENLDPVTLGLVALVAILGAGWAYSSYRRGQEGIAAIERSRQSYQDGRRDATSNY